MKKNNLIIISFVIGGGIAALSSCQEETILVNSNDKSFVSFTKNMTKDTTTVCFQFYPLEEGATVKEAEIPLEVSICGKIQSEDLEFTIAVDEKLTTLPMSQYTLPEKCRIKGGQLLDTIYVKLRNSDDLKDGKKLLALKVKAAGEVAEGLAVYSRAVLSLTDKLFKPDWWSVIDVSGDSNSVDLYYLGQYSQEKYKMFLEELQKDNVIFDGKDKQVLRKYSLKLKNRLKDENAARKEQDLGPLLDENEVPIEVVVAG